MSDRHHGTPLAGNMLDLRIRANLLSIGVRMDPQFSILNFAGSKMTRPQLSICIATYNRAGLLGEALTHLRDVCDDDVEIVVSDNCSPDDTQDLISSFAGCFRHFRAIRQATNRGALPNFAAAMSLA